MKKEIIAKANEKIEIQNKKELEFQDRKNNYMTWRWSGVSLYQSIFVVFLTSTLLIFVDLISDNNLILKILLMIFFAMISLKLYKRMVSCASKPIFVADNMTATLESNPELIKGENGQDYYVMKMSNVIYEEPKREVKNEK